MQPTVLIRELYALGRLNSCKSVSMITVTIFYVVRNRYHCPCKWSVFNNSSCDVAVFFPEVNKLVLGTNHWHLL